MHAFKLQVVIEYFGRNVIKLYLCVCRRVSSCLTFDETSFGSKHIDKVARPNVSGGGLPTSTIGGTAYCIEDTGRS
jgi:hypothetical protein